jgi:uncharacterized protein YciI
VAELRGAYVVEATYVEGAREKRAPYREEHLSRIAKLYEEGVVVVAGALADMSASIFVLDLEREDSARAIVETDVYWRNGIWTDFSIRKLNRVVFAE